MVFSNILPEINPGANLGLGSCLGR